MAALSQWYHATSPGMTALPYDEVPVRDLLMILRRRRRVIFWVVVLLTTVAALVGLQVTKTYTATALVMLKPEGDRVVNFEEVAHGLSADATAVETQIRFIQSRENLARVVENFGLYADTEIMSENELPLSSLREILGAVVAWLPDGIAEQLSGQWLVAPGFAKDPAADEIEPKPWELREYAIAALAGNLEVGQAGRSHVLYVSFTSTSPGNAARIVNRVAESYLEGQVDEKLSAIQRANRWLAERVEGLKQELLEAEMAVAEYRGAIGLVGSGNNALGAQELAALTAELIGARAERTAKEAKLQRVRELKGRGNGYESVAEVVLSPMVMSLRQQEAQLLRDQGTLSREYGERHPKLVQIKAELVDLREKLDQEIQNVLTSLENEVAVARSREQSVERTLDEAKGHSALTDQAEVRLREFEREAAASRRLYETFLTRLKETEEQQLIVQPNARIISVAQVPDAPSSPSPLLFTAVGLTASVILGAALALILEHLDSSIRSSRQVEELLQIPALGLIPKVAGLGRNERLHEYLWEKPRSSYAEGVRGLYTYIRSQPAGVDRPPKLILVTSALPGEGKTTLAASLVSLAAMAQQRTLLIDLDLRRPAVAHEFRLSPEYSIVELITNEVQFDDAVYRDEVTGVDVVAGRTSGGDPTALLSPERIASILHQARYRYDFVVIDTPPVLCITDAKALLPQVDAAVFVVQWERTKKDVAQAALKDLWDAPNMLGAVLSQVNFKKHAYYGYGDTAQHYREFRRYYRN